MSSARVAGMPREGLKSLRRQCHAKLAKKTWSSKNVIKKGENYYVFFG